MSTTKKVALVTGITGQDGSYLAELLLENIWFMGKTPCFFFNTNVLIIISRST
jgi:hypothetical protein